MLIADPLEKVIQVVTRLEVIIAFVVGFVLSALLCCVVMRCRRYITHQLCKETIRHLIYINVRLRFDLHFRRKQKRDGKDGDLTETLEMVNSLEESVVILSTVYIISI